jgi:hypothetical protein
MKRKVELFSDFLTQEGYRPSIDEDGDILFKSEGKTLCLSFDEQDEQFVRLYMPNFWGIDDEEERRLVEQACLETTKSMKVAKVFPIEDSVWTAVELFQYPIHALTELLPRWIALLHGSVRCFRSNMERLRSGQDDL